MTKDGFIFALVLVGYTLTSEAALTAYAKARTFCVETRVEHTKIRECR
jgi:hypothetical protein